MKIQDTLQQTPQEKKIELIRIPRSVLAKRPSASIPDCVSPVDGGWLAGGAVRRLVMGGAHDSDYDFFFKDEKAFKAQCAALDAAGFENTKGNNKFREYKKSSVVVQCIGFQYYSSLMNLFDSFDFTICQFALDGEFIVTTAESLIDLSRKSLVTHKITYPVATMNRLMKYRDKGFKHCSGTIKDILLAARNTDVDLETKYID